MGDGPIDPVLSPGAAAHLELAWEVPPLARFLHRLASFSRLTLFDKRGTGLSDRVSPDALPTLEGRTLFRLGFQIDWEAVLPSIQSPTLVLHRSGDLVAPIRQGRRIAEGIPGATFVELWGTDHFMWAGDQDSVLTS